MKKHLAILLAVLCMCALPAYGETDGDYVYALYDENGEHLTDRAGEMYVGDEYIAENNRHYRVVSVSRQQRSAVASYIGMSQPDKQAILAYRAMAQQNDKLICMYSTHSDECYVPEDGTSSKWENAGIYDVGNALKNSLEEKGIRVIYSENTFLPHDAAAYSRSKATAAELLKEMPDALFDIHRDAIPAEQYETTIDGETISKVRLFVGRSNPNADSNKAFAKQIKALADEKYPGLIKDIYIGKGNYNQELYGKALLLEMGTHEIEKDKVIGATDYLADIINIALFGASAKAGQEETEQSAAPVSKGVLWAIGLAVLGAAVYALAATGRFSLMWQKLKRGASEISGGITGKKPRGKK